MKCKSGCGNPVKKIVIEIDTELSRTAGSKVWGVQADGKKVAFTEASSVKKALTSKSVGGPPKFLDAMSITVVRTNPCGWVYINGRWYYRCW
jgi:hypothetical protein